jgi:hypothetical protein
LAADLPNVYFCWDNQIAAPDGTLGPAGLVGWDQGVWWTPYQPVTGYAILDDDHYRVLLRAKIIANYWDGTVPGAYEAWDALFQGQYYIIIQNGMAAATATFTWDGEPRQGWDRSSFALLVSRNNHLRYSSTEISITTGALPPYWSLVTHLNPILVGVTIGDGLETLDLFLSGPTVGSRETLLWFEAPGGVPIYPGERPDWTFSLYFEEMVASPGVDGRFIDIVVYDEALVELTSLSQEITPAPEAPGGAQSTWVPLVYPGHKLPSQARSLRPRLRLTHPIGATVDRYEIKLAGPQLELSEIAPLQDIVVDPQAASPEGLPSATPAPSVPPGPWVRTDGVVRLVYQRPAIEPRVNGGMHMIHGLVVPYQPPSEAGGDADAAIRVTEASDTRVDETETLIRVTQAWQKPEAPIFDAVLLGLFTGGHLGLRPAGVTAEYCVQSLIGAPFFAWDVEVPINTPLMAPPQYVAGWDAGAWPHFIAPTIAPYT